MRGQKMSKVGETYVKFVRALPCGADPYRGNADAGALVERGSERGLAGGLELWRGQKMFKVGETYVKFVVDLIWIPKNFQEGRRVSFERDAPTAADPKGKASSERVRRTKETVLEHACGLINFHAA